MAQGLDGAAGEDEGTRRRKDVLAVKGLKWRCRDLSWCAGAAGTEVEVQGLQGLKWQDWHRRIPKNAVGTSGVI